MRKEDDTTPPLTESERLDSEISTLTALLLRLSRQVERLDIRVANLESRRMLQNDPNDDEEWY